MPRRGPFAPIFNPGIRKGHINPGVAVGEAPVVYPFIVSSLTDATDLNGAFGVAVDGSYAYVAAFSANAVTVVDISDPANMSVVGTVSNGTTLASPTGIIKNGNYCYVVISGTTDRLTVVDVSTPASPSVAGSVSSALLDGGLFLDHSGTTIYACGRVADRLVVVDASTPTAPSVSGSVTDALLDGAWDAVKLPGSDHVIVSSINDSCVVVVDVSTPSSPSVVESLVDADLAGARGMVLVGDDLYVCATDGISGGRVVPMDVTSPTAITKGTATQMTHRPYNAALGSDGYLYVTPLGGGHVTQVSATDPPVEGVILTDAVFGTSDDMDIAAGGSFVFVTSFNADSLTSIQVAP